MLTSSHEINSEVIHVGRLKGGTYVERDNPGRLLAVISAAGYANVVDSASNVLMKFLTSEFKA